MTCAAPPPGAPPSPDLGNGRQIPRFGRTSEFWGWRLLDSGKGGAGL